MAESRTCPNCGTAWVSADESHAWTCDVCGAEIPRPLRCKCTRAALEDKPRRRLTKPKPTVLPKRPDRRRIKNGAGISTWNEYLRDLEKWANAAERRIKELEQERGGSEPDQAPQ